ncbi:uncharacterized protein LOC101845161 [Aplysia californica]|uniref:Uncharacterized protein LOC101845161 n=1 Tax=Aplysia californica TaxID=6500 RepID=A0ABM0ZXT4_APLCA|nr:uncharacterized protein LOC101845161 [Aplysia californica]
MERAQRRGTPTDTQRDRTAQSCIGATTTTTGFFSQRRQNVPNSQNKLEALQEKSRFKRDGTSRGLKTLQALLFVIVMSFLSKVSGAESVPVCPTLCVCPQWPQTAGSLTELTNTMAAVNCSGAGFHQLPLGIVSWKAGLPLGNTSASFNAMANSSTPTLEPSDSSNKRVPATMQFFDVSHNSLTSATWPLEHPNNNSRLSGGEAELPVLSVDLSHNSIQELGPDDMSVYTQLRSLDLSHNYLARIHPDAFQHLGSLTKLNLSHNAIRNLHNETLRALVNLHTLDLSYNLLEGDFLHAILQELSSLKYLYVSHNYFADANLPSLSHLLLIDISDNQLRTVPAFEFPGLPSLVTLSLSNNSIQRLGPDSFRGLQQLRQLSLDHNPLRALSEWDPEESLLSPPLTPVPSVFSYLTQLTHLNLSHTPSLSFLPPNLFTPLVELQVLDLSHSGLSHLSEITFHGLPRLSHVYLAENPFNCSCLNAWLSTLTSDTTFLSINASAFRDTQSTTCIQEDGILLPIFSTTSLCNEVLIHNTSASASVRLGSQLLLQCHYVADEPSVLEWSTPHGEKLLYHSYHPAASHHLMTPEDIEPKAPYHDGHYWHHSSSYHSELFSLPDRVLLLSDGSLYVDYTLRSDAGAYTCRVSNARYNKTATIEIYLSYGISTEIKIFAFIIGLLCALAFFTLNVVYVIITWIARRLVNKRRRETIRQLLENLNAYKSTQMTRIHENYGHQLSRVRNQYHIQRDKLHKNYTFQVTRVKRGCSNQVERVRDNYNTKLTALRDYSSNQIVQIRERANNQIVRIRDYGSTQLERLRETYKLQQQHVLKLLDTMNLENCRSVVETECMRTESMIFDIDLLGDEEEERTDSPVSEYNTASSSPATSVPDDESALASAQDDELRLTIDTHPNDDSESTDRDITIEMKTAIKSPLGREKERGEASEMWQYDEAKGRLGYSPDYYINLHDKQEDYAPQLRADIHGSPPHYPQRHMPLHLGKDMSYKKDMPLARQTLERQYTPVTQSSDGGESMSAAETTDFATPEASPTKIYRGSDAGFPEFHVQEPGQHSHTKSGSTLGDVHLLSDPTNDPETIV